MSQLEGHGHAPNDLCRLESSAIACIAHDHKKGYVDDLEMRRNDDRLGSRPHRSSFRLLRRNTGAFPLFPPATLFFPFFPLPPFRGAKGICRTASDFASTDVAERTPKTGIMRLSIVRLPAGFRAELEFGR